MKHSNRTFSKMSSEMFVYVNGLTAPNLWAPAPSGYSIDITR